MPSIDTAQLFWDDQDPNDAGWVLRYYTHRGDNAPMATENAERIDGDEDETTEELAPRVAHALEFYGRVNVKVLRGEQPRGRITVDGGAVVDWTS